MFETVSEKFQNVFRTLKGNHRISESNITDSLRDIRKALLGADVNYTVAKEFISEIKAKALGAEVIESVSPAQMFTKIVYDQMVTLLSMGETELSLNKSLETVLMVGLQGSGKTTSTAKIANWYKSKDLVPLLVAADTQRPAAKEQLRVLASQVDVPFFTIDDEKDPLVIVKEAQKYMKNLPQTVHRMIVDTAGRLHVDHDLMDELIKLSKYLKPQDTLFVADAMTGQDAVKAAKVFLDQLVFTGFVLTKMDGDSRGGAAMSIASITGAPVKFVGVGEKIDQFEPFYPDRLASRILGMGDIVSLVEKAQEAIDEKEAEKLEKKFRKNEFDLEDFLSSIQQIKKMGPLKGIMDMIPGMPKVDPDQVDEKKMVYVEAIIQSMTPTERQKPGIINGNRKKRIARGCGQSIEEVNRLLKQYREMKTMMRKMKKVMGKGSFKMPQFGG